MKILLIMIIMVFGVSCSSEKAMQKTIQEKVARETEVIDGETFERNLHAAITQSQTLTQEQKDKLSAIIIDTRQKNIDLHKENLRLRAVLIKELISQKVNEKEVALIKKDIKKNEADRLHNTLDAIDRISDDLRAHPDVEKYMDSMYFYGGYYTR